MFFPEGQVRVFVYGQPTDMRKSFDGLCALVRNALRQDPLSGALFVFINRRGTQTKVLYWDRTGFCLWVKRLEQGRLVSDWAKMRSREMDWTELKLLLEGNEPARRKRRYRRRNAARAHEENGASMQRNCTTMLMPATPCAADESNERKQRGSSERCHATARADCAAPPAA